MPSSAVSLEQICRERLLDTKWLIADSRRTANQWVELLVRNGAATVNVRPSTLARLALEVAAPEFVAANRTFASRRAVALLIDAIWDRLPVGGYFSALDRSEDLLDAVSNSILDFRLAGCRKEQLFLDETLESEAKAEDLVTLLTEYESLLSSQGLADEADVFSIAIDRLSRDGLNALGENTIVLYCESTARSGLEKRFLDSLPDSQRIIIRNPVADANASNEEPTSFAFFRTIGEVNEVREVFRRCLAEGTPLDDIEILHTDSTSYVPLIYTFSRRHQQPDSENLDGIPITVAEGLSASLSRPGRALALWLRWIEDDFPQRHLTHMLGEGLLDWGKDDDLNASFLAKLFRPISIGSGRENYLPKLQEQIGSLRRDNSLDPDVDESSKANLTQWQERRLKALQTVQRMTKRLLDLGKEITEGDADSALAAASTFLQKCARSSNELDAYAKEALIEELEGRQQWLAQLGVSPRVVHWIRSLPASVRVLGSGPRAGSVHVAHVNSGGHSGRRHTFLLGLDDRRFPGASFQDPILLDGERGALSRDLVTSSQRLARKSEDLNDLLERLRGFVTISWPSVDLADNRETFPSPFAIAAYRREFDAEKLDLADINAAISPPVSFAPDDSSKALDEADLWLWRLSDESVIGTDQRELIEQRYAHLARGNAAAARRRVEFGPYSGFVPEAGADLDPFSPKSPVLSASALETAGRCPLAFFYRNGLKLYAIDEMDFDPDLWLDPAQFGTLLHELFRRFLFELANEGKRPVFERDHQRLADLLAELVNQAREETPPPNENAFRSQYWRLIRTSKTFLQREEALCKTWEPRYFEVAIGLDVPEGPDAAQSALDDPQPVSLQLGDIGAIRIRGQVDRVDALDSQRYSIWDYKTGSAYGYDSKNAFRQGRRVQSILYLRMIEDALQRIGESTAVVEQFGYFFPGTKTHGERVLWTAEQLEPGAEILLQLTSGIQSGAFPATNDAGDCRFCDYQGICGCVKEVASASDSLLNRDDIAALEHFRELRRG